MAEILESVMVIMFGLSWPMNIAKSLRSGTAQGKSLAFLCFVLVGYVCGITSKFVVGNLNYVLFFYILNFVMVGIDVCLYFRNKRLDDLRSRTEEI